MSQQKQQHLHPPRLCFQSRSLSARESAVVDEADFVDAAGAGVTLWHCDNRSTTKMTPITRARQLSASTDQLIADFLHNGNASQMRSIQQQQPPQLQRVLPPCPPSPISGGQSDRAIRGGTNDRAIRGGQSNRAIRGGGIERAISGSGIDRVAISGGGSDRTIRGGGIDRVAISGGGSDRAINVVGNDEMVISNNGTPHRYRKKNGGGVENQQQNPKNKLHGAAELRRKAFQGKASAAGQAARGLQWLSTGAVECSSSTTPQAANSFNGFGGLKLAFSLFGLGKSAESDKEDKLLMPAATKRRSSVAAISAATNCFSPGHQSFQLVGTAPAAVPSATKRKTTTDLAIIGKKRISNSAQQLILSCLDKSKGDLSGRVLSRAIHKRSDFGTFCANLSAAEQWTHFSALFHHFIMNVLASLQNAEQIRLRCVHFGAEQVNRRIYGFKADFFATIANSLATECVFLDGASHSPTEAIEAWAELVEMMFSNVRDGYYAEVRRQRRCSSSGGGGGGDIPPQKCGEGSRSSSRRPTTD